MAQRLFGDAKRSDFCRRRPGQPAYSFFDHTADPALSRVRDLLEQWFAAYPAQDQKGLRGRLAGSDDHQFDRAFFELYLHALLVALGFAIDVEPELGGTTKRPDFRAIRAGAALLLEATVPDARPGARGRDKRRARVRDELNRIESPDFRLRLEIEAEDEGDPPMGGVIEGVRRWLDGLDWVQARAVFDRDGPDGLQPKRFGVGGWVLALRAWPRGPGERHAGRGSILGGPPDGGGAPAPEEILLDRLERKAKRYGKALDEPLVVAVRLHEISVGDVDVARALHGSPGHGVGLWCRDGEPRNRQVSAVLACDARLRPEKVAWIRPTLWRNPAADRPLPDLPFDCAARRAGGAVVRTAGTFDPATAFALPGVADVEGGAASWPGPAFVA